MQRNELLEAALDYAAHGLAVFPLKPNGKVPITSNGFYSATTDQDTIKKWWNKTPAANIGIATGRRSGGLVVIDLDKHITESGEIVEGFDSLREWQNKNGQLPDTAGTITGSGGNHWLFRSNKETGNRTGLLPAVDVRADGGYIVAPPSIHPNGNKYEWEQTINDYGIAAGGEILDALLSEGTNKENKQALTVPETIPEGKRNDTLFKLACSLQAKGLSDPAIYNAILAENKERCRPEPIPEQEIKMIVESVTKRYEKGKPQTAEKAQPQQKQETQEKERTGDDLSDFLDKIQTEAYKPHKTGVGFIDTLLNGGVENQTLNMLMAAPATGKTALCSQIAEALARNGKPVIYFNFEMSREQMLSRVISARLKKNIGYGMTAKQIRQGYKWTDQQREVVKAEIESYRQQKRPRYFDAKTITPELDNIIEYLEKLGEYAKEHGKEAPAVFVDYLHLINRKGADIQETIKETCIALKNYAVKYNTFVFAILASNRESMKKKGKKGARMTLYSGRDSSGIEYSADVVISLDFTEIENGEIDAEDPAALEEYKRNNSKWEMNLRSLKDRSDDQAATQHILFNPAAMTFNGTETYIGGFKPLPENGKIPF